MLFYILKIIRMSLGLLISSLVSRFPFYTLYLFFSFYTFYFFSINNEIGDWLVGPVIAAIKNVPKFGYINKSITMNPKKQGITYNYSVENKYSCYNLLHQKIDMHVVIIDDSKEKIKIAAVQTDYLKPKERFLSGTPTGVPGSHIINNDTGHPTSQVFSPIFVYENLTKEEREIFLDKFFQSENLQEPEFIEIRQKLLNFDFASHCEQFKKNEVPMDELSELMIKHAAKRKLVEHEVSNLYSSIDQTVSQTKNPVFNHFNNIFGKKFADFNAINTAEELTTSTQEFLTNKDYSNKNVIKLGEAHSKIFKYTIKNVTFKSEKEYQTYYMSLKSAETMKKIPPTDLD